jgi:hypothetical protein
VDDWLNGGARPIVEIAHDRVKELLNLEPPVELPAERKQALVEALKKAVEASEAGE